MKILITGHKGFIGQNMMSYLESKHEVAGYDFNPEQLPLVKDYDWVIHLGAISSTTETDVDKVILANEATKILHGEIASQKAEQTAKETFEGGGLGVDLPEIQIKSSKINKGINFLDFLSENKIMSSKSEARRAIANKGIKIDNVVVVDENKTLKPNDFKEKILKISYGKKKHYIIKII